MDLEYIVIFVLVPVIGIVFSWLTFSLRNPDDLANVKGMVCSFLAAITWIIFSSVWTYLFPVLPWLYLSYLWLGLGFVFIGLGLYYIVDYITAGYRAKRDQNTMQIRQADE